MIDFTEFKESTYPVNIYLFKKGKKLKRYETVDFEQIVFWV